MSCPSKTSCSRDLGGPSWIRRSGPITKSGRRPPAQSHMTFPRQATSVGSRATRREPTLPARQSGSVTINAHGTVDPPVQPFRARCRILIPNRDQLRMARISGAHRKGAGDCHCARRYVDDPGRSSVRRFIQLGRVQETAPVPLYARAPKVGGGGRFWKTPRPSRSWTGRACPSAQRVRRTPSDPGLGGLTEPHLSLVPRPRLKPAWRFGRE
ncbi:MAG: hypothetical protein JWP63_6705 [Candidatus Solibacter sp.]|nr:hypothetical protein [Candidatus Solibacter sp.]